MVTTIVENVVAIRLPAPSSLLTLTLIATLNTICTMNTQTKIDVQTNIEYNAISTFFQKAIQEHHYPEVPCFQT